MGSLERRLDKLQERSGYQRTTLVCPECGEEFTAYGDVALEFLVHQWVLGPEGEVEAAAATWRETPEDVLRLFDHEHDPSAFVEKSSGLPFLSKAVSGFNLGGALERSEDGT
jgi:hypothetical protein